FQFRTPAQSRRYRLMLRLWEPVPPLELSFPVRRRQSPLYPPAGTAPHALVRFLALSRRLPFQPSAIQSMSLAPGFASQAILSVMACVRSPTFIIGPPTYRLLTVETQR